MSFAALDPCKTALANALHATLSELLPEGATLEFDPPKLAGLIEKPKDTAHGDFALPCFRFAKTFKAKPQALAENVAAAIKKHDQSGWIDRIEVAGAFLNIFVVQAKLASEVLPKVADRSWFKAFSSHPVNTKTRVMIEYSQPNTHKEFHVGHARNIFLGNALIRLFRYCGYQVVSANYFGDEGTHTAKALTHINITGSEAPPTNRGEWLGKMYSASDRALKEAEGEDQVQLKKKIGETLAAIESKQGPIYKQWLETRQWSLDEFHRIYERFHIDFDVLFYESQVSEASQTIVDEYLKQGVFIEDDGAIGVDLKDHKLGFCILRKRDGNTIYATKDLVLAKRKFEEFHIDRSIYVVADEQIHHFKQVFKVLELMGFEQASKCFHLAYGMVVLPDGKMSSRAGTSITFMELVGQVEDELQKILSKYEGEWPKDEIIDVRDKLAEGALKFGMLCTDPVREIVFDLKNWLAFDGNSGPYLMYSFTRTQSIIRKAADLGHTPKYTHLDLLKEESERDLLRHVYDFNDVVSNSCEQYKPSTLVTHLFNMCKSFNRFYADVSVLKAETPDLIEARLGLVAAFSSTLEAGLDLMGITPPNRM
jgi:arginyl-tRNA synthetase